MSTATSKTSPRTTLMSFPWRRWKCSPRSTCFVEWERLSWTEARVDAGVAVSAFSKSLDEEPARVLVPYGLEEQNLW